jgi:small lipoprotein (TIGR04452 family)
VVDLPPENRMPSLPSFFARFLPAVLVVLIVGPGCLLTDKLGLQPLGSVSGAEVRSRAQGLAQVNFFLGVYSYCSQFDPVDVCLDESLTPSITGGIIAGAIASSNIADLEDDKFYTVDSASECLRAVAFSANLLTFSILDGKKSCSSVGCSPAPGSDVEGAGITVGLLGAQLCDLDRTGNIFSLSDYNLGIEALDQLVDF